MTVGNTQYNGSGSVRKIHVGNYRAGGWAGGRAARGRLGINQTFFGVVKDGSNFSSSTRITAKRSPCPTFLKFYFRVTKEGLIIGERTRITTRVTRDLTQTSNDTKSRQLIIFNIQHFIVYIH